MKLWKVCKHIEFIFRILTSSVYAYKSVLVAMDYSGNLQILARDNDGLLSEIEYQCLSLRYRWDLMRSIQKRRHVCMTLCLVKHYSVQEIIAGL